MTAPTGTFVFSGALTTTEAGAGSLSVDLNTNDPTTTISGATTIGANTTLSANSANNLNMNGNYTNNGTFTNNSGTVTLAGAGLMVAGFTKRKDAQDNYDIYKNNVSPSAPIYTELGVTRDEFYEETNKSNKKSQLLIYGGAAVFAVAGYILVNRIIWIQRIESRKQGQPRATDFQCNNYRPFLELKTVTSTSAGIGLTYHF